MWRRCCLRLPEVLLERPHPWLPCWVLPLIRIGRTDSRKTLDGFMHPRGDVPPNLSLVYPRPMTPTGQIREVQRLANGHMYLIKSRRQSWLVIVRLYVIHTKTFPNLIIHFSWVHTQDTAFPLYFPSSSPRYCSGTHLLPNPGDLSIQREHCRHIAVEEGKDDGVPAV